ncbi:MAG TPA: SPOR domain-containing protein, partial [Spirochaetia bacterium]|nr:SPOR domain-containing protein [Spirochaetia bacterium]
QSTASEQPSATDQADQQPAATDQATSTEQPASTDQATSTEQPASTDQATSTEQPAATDQAAQQQTTQQQGTATAQAPAGNPDDAAILSDAKARIPQKQVFQPPREDQKFVYRPKATPAASQATAQVAAGGATVTSVDGEPGVKPGPTASASLPLADVAAPEESRPQEVESEAAQAPGTSATAQASLPSPDVEQPAAVAGEPVQTEVTAPQTLPPTPGPAPAVALTPPEAPAAASATQAATTPAATSPASTGTTAAAATSPGSTTPAATVASATAQQGRTAAAVIASVPKTGRGTYYLQLAAFGTEQNARDLATKLGATYPALVVAPASAGATVYRVVIGPLNRAESGTLLLWFRYRGYPDAFLKQE